MITAAAPSTAGAAPARSAEVADRPVRWVRPPAGWLLAQLVAVAGAGVAAGLTFSRVFEDSSLLTMAVLAGAGAGAAVVGACSVGLRWAPSSTILLAALLGGPLGAVAVFRSPPAPAGVAAALDALRAAPGRILNHRLPVAADPEHLVVVTAVVLAAVVAAGELAVRRRAPTLPLVPLVAVIALPPVLGAGGPPAGAVALGAFLAAAGVLVLVRAATPAGDGTVTAASAGSAGGPPAPRRPRRSRSPWPVAAGAAVLVTVAVGAPALAPRLPGAGDLEPRYDPRSLPAGTDEVDLDDPLAAVNTELNRPQREVRATVEAPEDLELFRTTVLDRYDGVSFKPTLSWEPAGSTLPPPAEAAPPGSEAVRLRLTVADLRDGLVPATGVPTAVRGADVEWDPRSTTVHAEEDLPAGREVTIDALVRTPTPEEMDTARRDRDGDDTGEAVKPIKDAAVLAQAAIAQVQARTAGESGSADVRQLRALQSFLGDSSRFKLSPRPKEGVTLRHLTVLVSPADGGAGAVDASVTQYAATFAVLARTLGFATRVAVGYRPARPQPGEPYQLTSRDAFAWAEVKLEGLGWVPFVALPREAGTGVRTSTTAAPTTVPARQLSAAPTTAPVTTAAPAAGDETAAGILPPAPVVAGAGGGLLVAVPVGLAVAAVAARSVRRRRRATAAEPAHRVLGAWAETVDHLHRAGVPVVPSMTAAEVAGTATATLDGEREARPTLVHLHRLGTLVNQARFAPVPVSAAAADESWTLADAVGAEVRERVSEAAPPTRPGRLRRWFDPRSPGRWR